LISPRFINLILLLICALLLTACDGEKHQLTQLSDDAVILAFGDSLTFGTGSHHQTESYPAVLESLTGRRVINAGIPGEISEVGLARLPKLLEDISPDLVILCHGGNDILQRRSLNDTQENLEKMVQLIQNSGAEVLLIAVPNLSLTLDVPAFYPEIAAKYQLVIDEATLSKIERNVSLKSDQVHPNAAGYRLLASKLYELLESSQAL
jgi:lysophospholipase L1-like esterase